MKLYTDYKAPNPRRLTYFLQYKGIKLDTEIISLAENQNLSDEYTAINATQTIPALKLDDGTVLSDTIAICLYLEHLYPEKPMFGPDEATKAQVVGWCHRIFCYGFDPVAEIFRNSKPFFVDRTFPIKTKIPQNPDLIERGKLRLTDFWIEMNEHLKGREFIVGEQFTQADIDAWLVPSFAKWVSITVPPEYDAFHDWHARITHIIESLNS